MRSADAIAALTDLGFTALEAEVYLLLSSESPATGYRIAQLLGKASANVYKALESLEQKGAVLVEEGENRLARAIEPEELLAQADRSFRIRKERAAGVLSRLRSSQWDQKLYPLRSYDQVLERVGAMLERAETLALVDIFPGPFAALRPVLEATVARGVAVALEVYEPTELPGADVVVSWDPDSTLERWPGDGLHLVVDGREWLIALLARGERRVVQAFWTASPFLASALHTCLASDFMQMKLRRLLESHVPKAVLDSELAPLDRYRLRHTPGYTGFRALAVEPKGIRDPEPESLEPEPLESNQEESSQ